MLDAAEAAIRESGAAVGLAEVAATAGLTRSAVYAAFADRDAVIDALAHRHARAIIARLGEILADVDDPMEQTRASLDILASWFDDEPVLARLLAGRLDGPVRAGGGVIVSAIADILRAGFRARGGDEAAAEPWAHALVGAVASTIAWWSETRTMSRGQVVEYLFVLVWGGFSGAERGGD